jgi:hypothetical protein
MQMISYNPDSNGTDHPVEYHPERLTVSPNHNGKLCTLIASCGLRDPLALQHNSHPFPASHIWGSKRIDFILVTSNLVPAVTSSGSFPFHSLFHSDHWAYFMDFDSSILFSDPAYDIAPPGYRRLQLADPRLKNQYRDILYKQLEYHKVHEKVEALQSLSDAAQWTEAQTQEYQKTIDRIITDSMLYAEQNTGRKVSTRYEWSPELKKEVRPFRYWQLRFRQARRLVVSLPRLDSLQQQAGLSQEEVALTVVDQILLWLQQAANTLHDYQKRHGQLRATYLEELAEAIVLDQSLDLEHSSVVHVKDDRVTKQIKHLTKRENSGGCFGKQNAFSSPYQTRVLAELMFLIHWQDWQQMETLRIPKLGKAHG